nr:BLUF domain-containing protein [uncultured Undibacterium sp.]
MIRLLYCSEAKQSNAQEDWDKILITARKNNKALDITGVLVHGGGLFLQLLEGPENNVLRLYTKILDDKRHTDCRIIHISPTKERLFNNWTMGEIKRDPVSFEQIAILRASRLESVNQEGFLQVIREFKSLLTNA